MLAVLAHRAAGDTRSPAHARGRLFLVLDCYCVNTARALARTGNREWRLRPGIPSHPA